MSFCTLMTCSLYVLKAWPWRDSCINPDNSWRLKRKINVNWNDAKRNFRAVMTDPRNDKFPTLIVKGFTELTVVNDNAYWVH